MIDTLWSFAQKMKSENIYTPLNIIKQTIKYKDLNDAKDHLKEIMGKIKNDGFPKSLTPFVIGFAGYGNVSKGAQEILDLLPVKEINPNKINFIFKNPSNKLSYT